MPVAVMWNSRSDESKSLSRTFTTEISRRSCDLISTYRSRIRFSAIVDRPMGGPSITPPIRFRVSAVSTVVTLSTRSTFASAGKKPAVPLRRPGTNLWYPEKSPYDEPLHAAAPHSLEEPVAERVEDVLGRRVPEDLQMALLDKAVELDAEAGRLHPQAQRRLVKAEKEPGILGGRLREKMQK